jgi:putative hydrolase of the HAD superfamily
MVKNKTVKIKLGRPKQIFFDAGGTLFEPRESVGETYCRLARNYEHFVDAELIQARFLQHFRVQPPLAFPGAEIETELLRLEYQWWRRLVFEVVAGESFPRFDEFFAAAFAYYRQPDAWRLYNDVLPALQSLRELGVPCAVLSNFDARLFDLLRGFALEDYFSDIHISSRLGAAKPDQRIFAAALQAHGLQPHEAWHVGDSLREDFAGAQQAGLQPWLIARAGTISANPSRQLSRLDDLVEWLR